MLTIFSSAKRKGWVVNDGLIGGKNHMAGWGGASRRCRKVPWRTLTIHYIEPPFIPVASLCENGFPGTWVSGERF